MKLFTSRYIFISAIVLGAISIVSGYCAFFLLYDDVMDPDNFGIVVAVVAVLIGLIIFFISYGIISLVKKRTVIEQLRIFTGLFFTLGLIAMPSALTYFMVDALGPRDLFKRQESVTFDSEFEFESIYGNLNDTTAESILWNEPLPTDVHNYAWGESYYLRNLIHYYNLTTNYTLFADIIERIDIIVNNSDWNDDGVPGYGTDQYEGYYIEYLVWDGMVCLPIAEAAHLIKEQPALWSIYQDNYTIYLDMCERIIQKWNRTNWYEEDGIYGRYGYYLAPDSGKKVFNRIHSVGRVCAELYRITNNQTYKSMVEKMGKFFKMSLEEHTYRMNGEQHTMVIWPYSEYISTPEWNKGFGASDTSHASIDIDFAAYCYELGVAFDDADMEKLANTFFDFIFKGFSAPQVYADEVDGEINGDEYHFNIRDGYAKMWEYYRDPDKGLYIVERVTEEFVDNGNIGSIGPRMVLPYLLELEKDMVWV